MKKEIKNQQSRIPGIHYFTKNNYNIRFKYPFNAGKTHFVSMTKSITILLISVLFFSCTKVVNKPSWKVDAVIPVLNVSIRGVDLVNDSNMVLNADQSIGIVFEDSIFAFNFDSLIAFPGDVFNGSIPFPFLDTTYFEPGQPIFDPPFSFDQLLAFENGIKARTIKVKSGQIYVEVYNNSGGDLVFDYLVNSSSDENGAQIHIIKDVPKQQTTEASIDLSGYTFDLTGLYHDTVNTIRNTIAVALAENEPEAVGFSLNDTLAIQIKFQNMELEYGEGYFGQKDLVLDNQSIDINLFDNFSGTFQIPQAEVYLQAINEYGIDGRFNISSFSATNTQTNESISLEGAVLDSSFYFGSATETGHLEYLINRDTSVWDFSQSNILNLFGILPDKLNFSAHIQANTGGDSIQFNNFFYRDSQLALRLKASVNQGFSIQDMLFSDTVQASMDTSRFQRFDELDQAKLFLVVKNRFPLEMKLNIVFWEDAFTQGDTLVRQFTVAAPAIGSDHYSIDTAKSVLEIPLDSLFMDKLKKTKYIVYQSILSSATQDYVKIHADDKLKIGMVIETGYTINTNGL